MKFCESMIPLMPFKIDTIRVHPENVGYEKNRNEIYLEK